MSYNYPLPDGTVISVPDETPVSVAAQWARRDFPELYKQEKPTSSSGWNNVGSLISGVGNVVQVPGQLAGLAGLAAPDNALVKAGQGIKDYGQSLKSEERKEQELKIALAIQEAEKLGLSAEVTETLKQYASNPGVTLGMLVEQIPMLAATMGSGLGAQLGAKALVKGIGEVGLKRAGVAGAAGAGATMQGADVGAETYDRVYKAAVAKGFTPEAAHERALEEARKAALKAGAVSGATMAFLPGAEKALMGINPAKTALRGAARTGLGESVQEAAEEGSGAYFANVGEQAVDPTVDTTRGVGSRATTGAILGGLMGGATGAYGGQQEARKLKTEARAIEDAQAEAAASQEEEKKKQVEAAKDTPQYLLELDSKFQERNKTLADLTARIKAYGKPEATSAEALEKKQLEEQKRKLVKDTEKLKEEFVARRLEIERAKKDPQDFMMESLLAEPTVSAGSPLSLKAIREKIAAQQAEASKPPPAPEVEQAKKELANIMAGLQNYANITGGNITAADVLEKLTPELVAAAQKHKLTLPGMDPASSALLVKTAAKDFEKAQKADLTATMQQRQADLTAQATTATQETDPLAMLKESMAEQEEFQNTGEQNFDYLDNVFEKALGESNETGPRKVTLPEGVRPVSNASSILDRVDSLYAERDMADKDLDLASRSGNKEAATEAAARREKANTTLLGLVDTTPVAGGIVQERKKQEGAMADVAFLIDDLAANRTLGSRNPEARGSASSTPETLRNQISKARQQYVQAVIQEAAITRAAFGKALTEREALQAAAEIQRVFNEWVTRAGALPKEMAEEERVKVPAQMRGTEIVRGAEMEKFDPRPLAERRLGAYRAATEVFQDQINRIVAPLVSVREEGKRVEQPLRMQFAQSEAAKTAEARGETAQTRGGELRRRREYVGNLIERALTTRDTLPSITRGLQAAKDAIDAGQGGTDVVSDIEGQRFTAGLLDAAEELSTRVIEGRKERTQNDKLLREIAANVGRQFTYTTVKNEGNISRPRKGGQPVSTLRGQMPPPGEAVEGQQNLFDPAPLEQKQEATRERIAKLEKQVADLKAGKFQSLKEGVSASKRISGLEKAIKILQDDKKVGIDADVRAMRKEYARLQGDLGFFRATAANFEKAPEVKAGRKAVEQARAIKAAWDAIDARTEKERVDLKNRLDAIDARLSDFAWVKEAKKAGPVELDETREAEMATLQAERAEKSAVVVLTKGPKTAEELARDKIKQQVQAVRRAYQKAVLRALGNLKNRAMTPEMQARQEEAETAVQGAFTWLRELTAQKDTAKFELDRQKREIAKKEAELENEEGAEGLRLVLAGMVPGMNRLAKEQVDVLEQRIALEEQRLDAASKTLEEIRDQVRESWNGANLNAEAATDKTVAFEKLNLDYYANQLREQGYVVDVEKGTVETARGTPATQQAAELRRQKEALAQAEATQTNFAAQADALRPLQQGLGLPGTRVKSKRDQYGRVTRDIERIPSITEQDEATRAAREEAREQAAEERAATKAEQDAERATIQAEIDALTKQADDKRAEIQAAPNKRAQKPLEKELQAILAALGARKLALDNVGKKRTFRQQPVMRAQTSAPLNMRTGTPESRDVTMKARASNTKKLTAKEESALAKALAKQKVRDEAPTDYEADDDISGFGTSPDVYFSGRAPGVAPTIKQLNEARKHPLNGMTFLQAGEWLVGQFDNALQKSLANKVLQVLGNVPGTIEVSMTHAAKHNGMYAPSEELIYLSPAVFNDQPALRELVLHELTHAATLAGIETNPEVARDIYKLLQHVKAWTKTKEGQQYLSDHPEALDSGEVYAVTDVHEFVADTFSNPAFQEMLKQIPPQRGMLESIKNAWSAFINRIAALFGAKHPRELQTLTDAVAVAEQALLANWLEYETRDFKTDATFASPKRAYASPDIEEASNTFIGRDKGKLAAIREAASGLSIRTRFVDNYAALKEALKRGDATYAIQVMYDLMNYAQRNHMVQQSVMEGPPVRVKSKHKGKDVRMVEAQEGGPTLRRVSELLAAVKGFGNHQATSDAFTMYALAKRAQTRGWDRVFADTPFPVNASAETNQRIRAENAKKAKARAQADALAADKNSPFLAAYKEYQDWNKGMLQFAQQAGVIKEEDFRRLASEGNYTPLFRKDKHGNLVLEIDQGRDITVGRLADEPHLQKLLGGSGQVMDFFTASVRNASVLVDAALHNIASREAVMALQAMGAAHPVAPSEKGENIIEFRKNGDLQRFAVDTTDTAAADIPTDLLTKGFAGVPASLPGWVRMMGVPAQLLRKTVTRNPLYMFRQLVRDPLSAWLATGADMNPLTDTLAEVGKSLTGKSDKTLDRRGITGGMLFSENDMDIERIQNEAKKAPAWSWGYWMAKLDHAAMGADAITRRNVYQGALREGASEIQATLAAYEAMPFSKRGSSPSVRSLNHMVPFLSAAIQGWDVLYRSAFTKDMPLADRVNIRNKLLARGAMIGGITMMYAMAMGDDDVYKNANTAERLSNWFVKIPGTDITIKLPTPFEYGVLFKMIPEAIVRSATQDKDFGDEMRMIGGALWQMVPNVVLPQGVIPLVEAQQNTSFFTGRPIEGRALQDIDIGLRADRNTSELSKLMGFDFEAFGTQWGISPKMLEHVLGQYTAGLYPAFAALIDNILPAPTVDKPDRTLAELPLFKSALQQEDAGGQVNRLYDKIDKFTRYSETFKKLVETNPVEAQEYMADNAENIAKGGMAAKMKAAIDKISNAENVVRNSTMTAAQKKEALDNFKRVKTNLSSQFASAL